MADRAKRLSTNVDGNFFVDSTCINCDTCRQLAPKSFVENGEYSSVHRQPENDQEHHQAYQALLACPVGSIGAVVPDKAVMRAATVSFPLRIDGEVFYNGFNSEKSYGANSYFVRHPGGNWLIDSPRYMKRLEDFFERMGGIAYIFLTHEDDIGDAPRYAGRFGASRIIHRADADAQPDAEWVVDGLEPVAAAPGFTLIPVPGHTDGSMALHVEGRYLFTGDHMSWDREINGLRLATVYVWDEETLRRSAAKLMEFPFEWVLPGHGDRIQIPSDRMEKELRLLLARRAERR
jgi:glyoxylase-like metal-dependent hydrolase (beta-lactamase superfamily II)/ferredoxin